MPKIIIGINTSWNFLNFRSGLIRELIKSGYEVVAVAPEDEYTPRLLELGCRFLALPMDSNGANPFRDLLLFLRFYLILRRERPDIYLGYTVKPNIYGSLASNVLGIPVINNIAGLGSVFSNENLITRIVMNLYRLSLSRSVKVFFQNKEDQVLFINQGLVRIEVTDRLPGSGVDLTRFSPSPLPNQKPLQFLFIGRILWQKGVGEYVAAARLLKRRGVCANFSLLGFLDVKNPSSISKEQMNAWVGEGAVRYLGVSNSIEKEIANADCVVLPSFYPEGVPRSLLEAAAMGRPIITTDTTGCRDVVDDHVNGYLIRERDASDLAEKIEKITELSIEERNEMGRRSREKIVCEFDEKIVISKYKEAIGLVLGANRHFKSKVWQ